MCIQFGITFTSTEDRTVEKRESGSTSIAIAHLHEAGHRCVPDSSARWSCRLLHPHDRGQTLIRISPARPRSLLGSRTHLPQPDNVVKPPKGIPSSFHRGAPGIALASPFVRGIGACACVRADETHTIKDAIMGWIPPTPNAFCPLPSLLDPLLDPAMPCCPPSCSRRNQSAWVQHWQGEQ